MGGLFKHMTCPSPAITCWIGALALIGFAGFFSGFYSKDFIIESVHESHRWGATYAYWCVLVGVFITALYTFRMIFMTFHGTPNAGRRARVGRTTTTRMMRITPMTTDAAKAHDDHGHDAPRSSGTAAARRTRVAVGGHGCRWCCSPIPSMLIGLA